MVADAGAAATSASAVEEVRPQRVRVQPVPVTKTKPTRRLRPGDLICGQCGEGNPPTRKFCSRCGDELAAAEVVRTPWWHRFMFWRRRKIMAAGKRPGQPGTSQGLGKRLMNLYRKAWRIGGVVILAASMLYIFVPPAREYVNNIFASPVAAAKGQFNKFFNAKFVPVRPNQVTAPAQVSEHEGSLAFDQFSNTYWAAPWNPQAHPRLTVTFDRPVTISRMILTSGASDDFIASHRPLSLHLVYSNNQADTIRVEDGAKPQTFDLPNAKDVTSIEISVTEIFQSEKGPNVAVTELEFFARE